MSDQECRFSTAKLTPQQHIEIADQAWNDDMIWVARHHYEQAVEVLRTQISTDVNTFLHGLSMLAILAKHDDEYEKAVAYYSEAIGEAERSLGLDDPDTIFQLRLKTACLHEMGHLSEAEVVARLALERAERALGPLHRFLGDAMMMLARILWNMGRFAESEIHLRAAVDHDRELQGTNSGFHVTGLMALAEFLEVTGRVREALDVILYAREILRLHDVLTEEGKAELDRRYESITGKLSVCY